MSNSRRTIRRELYDAVPGLGFSGTADSLVGATLTDTFQFRDATVGANYYRGMYMYRPDLSTDDRVRKITSVATATGVVTVTGASYADTAELDYEVVGVMHPDELNACIDRALRRVFYELQVPLTAIVDGDMETSGVSNWTASDGSITPTKETSGDLVLTGTQSLKLVSTSATNYLSSNRVGVDPDEPFFLSAVVLATTGNGKLSLWDATNTALIGEVAFTEWEHWRQVWLTGTTPSTCREIQVRLYSQSASTTHYYNHVVFYGRNHYSYEAPSWLDEQYKLLKLREARYMSALDQPTITAGTGVSVGGGMNSATSKTYHDWLQPSMFSLDPLHVDVNPYTVQLLKPIPTNELWLQGKRPFSDAGTLSADTSTTNAPLAQLLAYAKDEVARVCRKRYPHDKRWDVLQTEAVMDLAAETQARPEIPLQPIRREVQGRI